MHRATAGNDINSEYTNHSGNSKNCYYTFNSEYNEDCMYLRFADKNIDCMDCNNVLNSQLCYECVNIDNCYMLFFSDDCKNSRDSAFLRFCRRTSNSLFCYGLEDAQYHIFNEPHTKEEFFTKIRELGLSTYSGQQKAIEKWNEWSKQFPLIREVRINCENSTGNSLYNCKSARDCYNCSAIEDCRYILNSVRVKDTYDFYAYGEAEICYECVTMMQNYNARFCVNTLNCDNVEYSDNCRNCHFCFGCVGLHGKSYCIFNKQYSKAEYEELVPRIREHMTQTGEYGEFFPVEMSYFPYEDTLAQDYFPIKEKVIQQVQGTYEEVSSIPDNIGEVNANDIESKSYFCPETKKLFRFQKRELEFYKKLGLPLPRVSFEARYKRRNKLIPFPY